MLELYLVRHGQDPQGYRGGWSQLGLTPEGIAQAEALAERFRREKFQVDNFWCSDLPRTVQTAQVLAPALNLPIQLHPEWREVNNGELAGIPETEAQERYPGLFWAALAMDERYPGGESPNKFYERITTALTNLTHAAQRGEVGPRILIVTHGGPIKIVSAQITGGSWSNRLQEFSTGPTSLHSYIWQAGRWSVNFLNDTSHLSRPDKT